jgi:DNA-binding CsgD family transcriptional regulator
VRKQRVKIRVAVYAASSFHRAALMRLVAPGVHAVETTIIAALPKLLGTAGVTALVSHADNFADVVPVATECRVPLVLIAADQMQALAVSVPQVVAVLLEADPQLATHLTETLQRLALGLPMERYDVLPEGRRSKGHVVPTDFAQRLAPLQLRRRELDVVWLYYQGMEPEQAARVLGVEVSTVYTHWKSAREKVPAGRKEVRRWVDETFPEDAAPAFRP